MDYYGPTGLQSWIVSNDDLSRDVDAVKSQFDAFTRDKPRVWLVNYGWAMALQPRSIVEQQLDAKSVRTYSQGFQDASLALYDLRSTGAAAPVESQDVGFGEQIKLIGVRERAKEFAPGDTITLDLLWRAEKKPDADYTVFMHLRNAGDGGQIAAFDSPPLNGAAPTSGWSPGDVITDTRGIQIPDDAKPGEYQLVIGWYRYPSFERLKLDGQDATEFVVSRINIGDGKAGFPRTHAEGDPGNRWPYRVPITITNALSTPLRDYQVRVTLDASFDFDHAQPDGADLRFADENSANPLNYWIEEYDATNRRGAVWVKLPELPAQVDKTIYLYYGNASAEDLSSGGRTFDMFDDFGRPGPGYYEFGEPTTVMTRTEAWETQAPHTLSVIERDKDGYKYWGYYGLADCGGIGLARSNDLVHWQKAPQPLLNKDGERWPSVQKVGDTVYMIYDRDYCGTSHLVMRTSEDGLNFSDPYTIIVKQEPGVRNQNPALFHDPNDGRFYLYWFRGGHDLGRWQIKMRSADTVEGLADPSSERVLIDAPYELAAPNMMFHDGTYFLSTEINENAWKTKIYAGPSPAGPFTPLPDGPQLSDNQACLFQYPIGDTMHGYICKDTGAGWVLNHRSADLSQGRTTQRKLDPGVWTPLSGAWELVESQEVFAPGIVLSGTGQGLLKTALQGVDYVFEATGRAASGAWGVAVRVRDADNFYAAHVQPSGALMIDRVVNGKVTTLAAGLVKDWNPAGWHRLTVRVNGSQLDALLDDQLIAQVQDTGQDAGATHDSGSSALFVDGAAQFDQVAWRKFAPAEPTVTIGATESQAQAKGNWLGERSMSASRVMDAPAVQEALPSASNSPLLTVIAAFTLAIGLGILIAGFVRGRR
jgi:hypothetical protein